MSRVVVLGGPGPAALIAAAMARLDAGASLVARLDDSAGDGCELLLLHGGAGDPALIGAVEWAARRRSGAPPGRRRLPLLVLSPGTAPPSMPVLAAADVVVCGRHEAETLTGIGIADPLAAEDAALAMTGLGPGVAVINLGGEGAVVARAERATYLPPFTVAVVDPAGAGECFAAALALAMLEGLDNFAATGYALAAAAVCAGRPGGAGSMPGRDDVERMAHSVDLRRDPGTLPVEFPR